jgi:hypothetical protein
MALKIVNTESLDAVADAINAKTGTSGAIQFPEGFVEAIEAIQAGGGEDLSAALTEQEALVAELKSVIATKAKLGDAKLPSVLDGTVTELTAEDLAGATSIRDYAFYFYKNLVSANLPKGIVSIGKEAFYACSKLASIMLNDDITSIGESAFGLCYSLINVSLPEGVNSIGNRAFDSCLALQSIRLPDSITKIGTYAFYQCEGLTSITLSHGLSIISTSAFRQCIKLANVVIPNNITKIDSMAFADSKAIEYIDLTSYGTDGTFPTLANTSAFSNCGTSTASGTFQIRVPSGRKAELAAMTNWSTYADNIVEV